MSGTGYFIIYDLGAGEYYGVYGPWTLCLTRAYLAYGGCYYVCTGIRYPSARRKDTVCGAGA